MNIATLTIAALSLAFGQSVSAHVTYTDLSNPDVSPGGVNGGSFTNNAWFNGTTTTLADSHSLAGGTYFKFHLDHDSFVTIVFSDSFNSGVLNPAFSVYRGLFADEAHDDSSVDPLNPSELEFDPPPPHLVKKPSPVDDGVTADAFGRVSPFRDTEHITFVGQFDALHSWSMANPSGDWSVVQYVAHAPPQGGNSVSRVNLLLSAGDYTIAAAGGTNCIGNPSCVYTNVDGTISFSATTAPDADVDGHADGLDNCRLVANLDQFDGDHDGYGNRCDGDFGAPAPGNGATNAQDYAIFRTRLGTSDATADLFHNGTVNAQDYSIFRTLLGSPPGPSGLACAGTVPCPSP